MEAVFSPGISLSFNTQAGPQAVFEDDRRHYLGLKKNIGVGITVKVIIQYCPDVLPMIRMISWYSDSAAHCEDWSKVESPVSTASWRGVHTTPYYSEVQKCSQSVSMCVKKVLWMYSKHTHSLAFKGTLNLTVLFSFTNEA